MLDSGGHPKWTSLCGTAKEPLTIPERNPRKKREKKEWSTWSSSLCRFFFSFHLKEEWFALSVVIVVPDVTYSATFGGRSINRIEYIPHTSFSGGVSHLFYYRTVKWYTVGVLLWMGAGSSILFTRSFCFFLFGHSFYIQLVKSLAIVPWEIV